jgi:hypothetical protein
MPGIHALRLLLQDDDEGSAEEEEEGAEGAAAGSAEGGAAPPQRGRGGRGNKIVPDLEIDEIVRQATTAAQGENSASKGSWRRPAGRLASRPQHSRGFTSCCLLLPAPQTCVGTTP